MGAVHITTSVGARGCAGSEHNARRSSGDDILHRDTLPTANKEKGRGGKAKDPAVPTAGPPRCGLMGRWAWQPLPTCAGTPYKKQLGRAAPFPAHGAWCSPQPLSLSQVRAGGCVPSQASTRFPCSPAGPPAAAPEGHTAAAATSAHSASAARSMPLPARPAAGGR